MNCRRGILCVVFGVVFLLFFFAGPCFAEISMEEFAKMKAAVP